MTIGFDASRAFVENRTGTENYSFELLKALAKIDTENRYLIYLRPSQVSNPIKSDSKLKSQNWPDNFQFKVINLKYLWTQIGLALRTFIDPLDVLFVPSHTLPLIRKPGLKTVITVHDLGAEYLPSLHQLKQAIYLKLMAYYQLKTASKIIAVSEATKKDLVKKIGIEGEKIQVVYEGVGDEFRIENSKFRIDIQRSILRRFGLENMKYFLFVGTIQPRKNLRRLIIAFKNFLDMRLYASSSNAKINDERLMTEKNKKSLIINHKSLFKLVLVGGSGWKSDPIYSLPEELGIREKVKFLGRVSDRELAALYNGAVALTYPSLFEGFGLPILEAFASGCPVITSNISSMPEVAGGAALLINPLNTNEIAGAMVKLADDDRLVNSLIKKGNIQLRKFSWEKSAKETVKILTEVRKQK